jgi:hypothetical protein
MTREELTTFLAAAFANLANTVNGLIHFLYGCALCARDEGSRPQGVQGAEERNRLSQRRWRDGCLLSAQRHRGISRKFLSARSTIFLGVPPAGFLLLGLCSQRIARYARRESRRALGKRGVTGDLAAAALECAGLAANKNLIPFDPRPPEAPSGLRLSSNAGTTSGFGVSEFQSIGGWIDRVPTNPTDMRTIAAVRDDVRALCKESSDLLIR